MESANKVIYININIEDIIYNVTLRHSEAVKVMIGLPPNIVGKAFEALVSPERTQVNQHCVTKGEKYISCRCIFCEPPKA